MSFMFGGSASRTKSKTDQTTHEENNPWAPAIPYITGAMGEGQKIYDEHSKLTPEEEAQRQRQIGVLTARQNDPARASMRTAGQDMLDGKYNPNIRSVGPIGGPRDVTADQVTADQVTAGQVEAGRVVAPSVGYQSMGPASRINGVDARAAQGALDPTRALSKVLSGQADNVQIGAMADAATRQGERMFQDRVQDTEESLTRSVLPSIRSGAVQAGGYGGSRQGIAEGLALAQREKDLARGARDLGIAATDASATLRGNAYERAQDRMASAADSLDSRAMSAAEANANRTDAATRFDVSNAQDLRKVNADYDYRTQEGNVTRATDAQKFNVDRAMEAARGNADRSLDAARGNADRSLDVAKTNASLDVTNNAQEMQRAGMIPGILKAGQDMVGSAQDWEDSDFGQMMSVLGLPRSLQTDMWTNWMNSVLGAGGLGGTTDGRSTSKTKGSSVGVQAAVGK